MDDSRLDKLRKEADETRHALNNLFVNKVINSTKGAAPVAEQAQTAQQSLPKLVPSRSYLIVLCDIDTNAITGVSIWSSPEWHQSRLLDDSYSYVALESSGMSFEDASSNLVAMALSHLYYYATGQTEALPGTIERLRSRAGQVAAMRYARLLSRLRDCDAYKVHRVVAKQCVTNSHNPEFVENYLTLIDTFLPNIKVREQVNGIQTADGT